MVTIKQHVDPSPAYDLHVAAGEFYHESERLWIVLRFFFVRITWIRKESPKDAEVWVSAG